MRVALTGTPGTGKTTVADRTSTDLTIVPLTAVVRDAGLVTGRDADRDTLVADIDALREHFAGQDDVLFESHLAHHLPVDRVIVLRCHPEVLERRLGARDWPVDKITENAEAEALDVILAEAVETHTRDRIYEIDTTDRTPDQVARTVEAVIAGDREPSAGAVDFVEYL